MVAAEEADTLLGVRSMIWKRKICGNSFLEKFMGRSVSEALSVVEIERQRLVPGLANTKGEADDKGRWLEAFFVSIYSLLSSFSGPFRYE